MTPSDYLVALYGRCAADDGEIVLVDASKCRPIGFYRVDQLDRLASDIDRFGECFVKVNLMDAARIEQRRAEKIRRDGFGYCVGNREEVRSIVGFALDLDAGKRAEYPSRESAIKACEIMPQRPTMIVDSDGPAGGFHCYWLLSRPHRIEGDEDRLWWSKLAHRWQERLRDNVAKLSGKAVDSTANLDRLLRPVGSLRQSGHRVKLFRFEPRYYDPADLYQPPSDREVEAEAKREVRVVVDRLQLVMPTGKAISDYLRSANIGPELLLAEAGYTQLRDSLQWRRPGAGSAGRSLLIATDRDGINVFSGADPAFDSMKRDGGAGKFHSLEAVFVGLRFGGDWKAAAAWCRQRLSELSLGSISIGGDHGQ
jgi:hypothetical protein